MLGFLVVAGTGVVGGLGVEGAVGSDQVQAPVGGGVKERRGAGVIGTGSDGVFVGGVARGVPADFVEVPVAGDFQFEEAGDIAIRSAAGEGEGLVEGAVGFAPPGKDRTEFILDLETDVLVLAVHGSLIPVRFAVFVGRSGGLECHAGGADKRIGKRGRGGGCEDGKGNGEMNGLHGSLSN